MSCAHVCSPPSLSHLVLTLDTPRIASNSLETLEMPRHGEARQLNAHSTPPGWSGKTVELWLNICSNLRVCPGLFLVYSFYSAFAVSRRSLQLLVGTTVDSMSIGPPKGGERSKAGHSRHQETSLLLVCCEKKHETQH